MLENWTGGTDKRRRLSGTDGKLRVEGAIISFSLEVALSNDEHGHIVAGHVCLLRTGLLYYVCIYKVILY